MIRIGTSGWSYDHWADVLYRPGLPVAKRLARYVEEFETAEPTPGSAEDSWPRSDAQLAEFGAGAVGAVSSCKLRSAVG